MELGLSTSFFYHQKIGLFEGLHILKESGIKHIELWTVFYGCKPFFDWKDSKIVKNVIDKCAEYNINIYSIHAPFSFDYELASLDTEIQKVVIEDLKEIVDVANFMKTSVVVVHPASKPNSSKSQLSLEEYKLKFSVVRKGLDEVVEFINKKNYNIKIALENQLPHIMFSTAEELLELINFSDKNVVGICFDTGHAELFNSKYSMCDMLNKVKNNLTNLHISDTDGKEDKHLLLGEGRIKWHCVTEILQLINYQNPFMLEILTPIKDGKIKETIEEAKKRVKTLFLEW
ncbi:MAG: sugar phosphate isomerase/epimerase family protein [Endomicrobiia bacterium]